MNFESLAKQGRTKVHPNLAGINKAHLVQLRNENLRNCFASFNETESRLEMVTRIHGVEYINDSASVSSNSTWFSLESMTKPVIWIACSEKTETNLTDLIPLALEKVKIVVVLGSSKHQFERIFAGIIPMIFQVNSVKEAVNKAAYLASVNDMILFSPACPTEKTSKQLATEFKQAVHEL